jgi:CheY-like chemotaxis protein
MASLMHYTDLNAEQQDYLQDMERSADSLLLLINDILDLAKIEAEMIELEYKEFSLHTLLDDVTASQRAALQKKQLTLHRDIASDIPECVLGDRLRLKQILFNLLGNAVKFTHEGSITISALLLEQQQNNARIRITITDTGIGMSPETLQRIFAPFVQADSSTTRCYGGTGLGLSICKRLSELMGGAISVESMPGEGSSFHLELPFKLCIPKEPVVQRPDSDACAVLPEQALTVLVADDNMINLRTAEMLLQKLGHQVICANNGRQAVDQWQIHAPDVILMDISMPVMDGVEALHTIRQHESTCASQTRVIALTADALKGTKTKLLQLGFDGYLSKPIIISALRDVLQQFSS